MTKEDAPPPNKIPRKRYQLQRVPDLWLAIWLTRNNLTERQHMMLVEERERRQEATQEIVVLVLRPREGMTKPQKLRVAEIVSDIDPHAIKYWTAGRGEDYHDAVKGADVVVAAPKELARPTYVQDMTVWSAILYARHRRLRTHVVLSTGKDEE